MFLREIIKRFNCVDLKSQGPSIPLLAASSVVGTHFHISEKHPQNRCYFKKKKVNKIIYLYWWRWCTFSNVRCWGTTIDFWWSGFWRCWTGGPQCPHSAQLRKEGKPGCGASVPFVWKKGHCTLQKQGPNNTTGNCAEPG